MSGFQKQPTFKNDESGRCLNYNSDSDDKNWTFLIISQLKWSDF